MYSAQGDRAFCALSWADGLVVAADIDDAHTRIRRTVTYWRNWLSQAHISDHPLRPALQRSALAIKGLTYMPTGATVAAITTSLPETPGGERNWDYRYTWMRDTTFTRQALHYLNLDWEAGEFMQFVADLEPNEDGSLQIMYSIDGRKDLASLPPDAEAVPAPSYAIHAGFYRNVRATRFAVIAALERALDRRSVLDDDPQSPKPPMEKPMTTLYLTGHSLGGAMAALMAVMLSVEPDYIERFARMFKGASTFGAPMVGSPEFANACAANTFLDRNVVRYVYRRDPVPHLPPSASDDFQHFGREYRYERAWKETSDKPITQMGDLVGLIEAPLGFAARQFRLLRGIPFRFSLNDHGPQHYISAITPKNKPNEFGDAYLIPAR